MNEEKRKKILGVIDHTLLDPNADDGRLRRLCEEAAAYGTASVCVAPSAVAKVKAAFPSLTVCTVIGFPLGYQTAAAKLAAVKHPVMIFQADDDSMVSDGGQNRFVSQIPAGLGCLKRIPGSRHEIYRSNDEVLFPWWHEILEFYAEA